jgi:hypothetical protein
VRRKAPWYTRRWALGVVVTGSALALAGSGALMALAVDEPPAAPAPPPSTLVKGEVRPTPSGKLRPTASTNEDLKSTDRTKMPPAVRALDGVPARVGTTLRYPNGLEVSVNRLGWVTAKGDEFSREDRGRTILLAEVMVRNGTGREIVAPEFTVRPRLGAAQYTPDRTVSDDAVQPQLLESALPTDEKRRYAEVLEDGLTATALYGWIVNDKADLAQVTIDVEPALDNGVSMPGAVFEGEVGIG